MPRTDREDARSWLQEMLKNAASLLRTLIDRFQSHFPVSTLQPPM
jgi:hypothetical protein